MIQDDIEVYYHMGQLQLDVTMYPTNEEKIKRADDAEAELLAQEDYNTASDRKDQPGHLNIT